MIGLLVLAMQSAPVETVVDSVTVGTSFQTTPETQDTILHYQHCLAPPGVLVRAPDSGTSEARARARISACAETRKWAESRGISAYGRRNGEPDAADFMRTSLDQVEQGHVAQAKFEDKLMSGEIKPGDLNGQLMLTPDGSPDAED